MKNFIQKLVDIDRKVIFILIALAAVLPLIFRIGLPTYETRFTKNVFEKIETVKPNQAIIMSFSFGPDLAPELLPMTKAVLRHCFIKKIKVIGFSFYPQGAAIAQVTMDEIASYYGAEPGMDYVCYGYKTPVLPVILGIGDDIHTIFNEDVRGVATSDLPMMEGIHNYDDINLVLSFTGSSMYRSWITYARGRYGQDLAIGCTGIVAAEVYPFLQSKQLLGSIGAIKGAAEYEQMVDKLQKRMGADDILDDVLADQVEAELLEDGMDKNSPEYKENFDEKFEFDKFLRINDWRRARTGMDVQAVAHIVIIVFIIIGNIGYFAEKRKKKTGRGK